MPISLTQAEIDAISAEYCRLVSSIEKRQAAVDAQNDVVQAATDADNAEKKVFNFYDDSIIKKYEDEKEQLTGEYIESPVTTTELDDLGQLNASNRLFPAIGDTKPVRIAAFDGSGLVTTGNEVPGDAPNLNIEPYWIDKELLIIDRLQNGYSGRKPPVSATMNVDDLIDQNTTQITISSTEDTETFDFQVGDEFLVTSGSQQIAIRVTNVVSQNGGDPDAGTCSDPFYTDETTCTTNSETWTPAPALPEAVLDIEPLSSGSVVANGGLDAIWAGFNDTERSTKTATYQYLLDQLILELESYLDERVTKLNLQKDALELNEDPLLDPTVLTNVNDAITFINDWKVSKDVDDAELTSLDSEATSRDNDITARLSDIDTDKALFYDQRYDSAVNIGDTSRGTARIKFFRIDSQDVTAGLKATEQDRLQAIEDTLILAGEPIPEC